MLAKEMKLLTLVFGLLLLNISAKAWLNQRDLVQELRNYQHIKSKEVAAVMLQVDRGSYVTESPYSDIDESVPLGYGAYFSPAHMHAFVLEELKDHLIKGHKALDVGSGSGYLTVCMALMIGKKGYAVGIDHIKELVNIATNNVMTDNPELLNSGRIRFLEGDGKYGFPNGGPYDAIHVGASVLEIPEILLQQLKPGGRMIVPVGRAESSQQDVVVLDKTENGTVLICPCFKAYCEPLTEPELQLKDKFI